MHTEAKRIFVPNLPEDTTEEQIRNRFFKYGDVTSVEIKFRKEVNARNHSHKFAFININTTHQLLQQCFEEFSKQQWNGNWVEVQLAKESFLERLKKEREESHTSAQNTNGYGKSEGKRELTNDTNVEVESPKKRVKKEEEVVLVTKVTNKKVKVESSSSDTSSSSSEDEVEVKSEKVEVPLDYVIKSNKNKQVNNKIEGAGLAPIHVQNNDVKKKSKDPHREKADQKRLNSMLHMRQDYMQQKSMIKNALSNIDKKQNSKITFNDDDEPIPERSIDSKIVNKSNKNSKKLALFEGNDDDEEELGNGIKLREEYEGKRGKKLFEMQQRFNQDDRFKLDARFVEDDVSDDGEGHNAIDEHAMQLQVLGDVLKRPLGQKSESGPRKTMLRFDPNQPEHTKYELEDLNTAKSAKKKKERKAAEEEVKMPEVSAETFYEISEKIPFQGNDGEGFSLMKALGRDNDNAVEEDNDGEQEEELAAGDDKVERKKKKSNGIGKAFKYDSSDDEDENKVAQPENGDVQQGFGETTKKNVKNTRQQAFFGDRFFFLKDDYRLQEGVDFVKRLHSTEEEGDFAQIRSGLKKLVKSKFNSVQKKVEERNRAKYKKKRFNSSAIRNKKRIDKAYSRT